MDHLASLTGQLDPKRNGKTLHTRATGRFYTHELAGRHLASSVARSLARRVPAGETVRVIDPFCGDGRLVAWLFEAAPELFRRGAHVEVWDHDPEAVHAARETISSTARTLGLEAEVVGYVGDTFERARSAGGFDAVVTNPPWELLKPDSRELANLDGASKQTYITELRAFDSRLAEMFPLSQPSRKFAGWGTNLARVGTEVAARLVAPGGACGVVSPSSLFADTTSGALRRYLFEQMALEEITYFPAEARLFEAVDVQCVVFVASRPRQRRSRSQRLTLARYDSTHAMLDTDHVELTREWLRDREYSVPVGLGADGVRLLEDLDAHPQLADLEGNGNSSLWAGRELDETRRERFVRASGEIPFVKGRNIVRFAIRMHPDEYVDPAERPIPKSSAHVRLAWRDISRPSQKRRIHASLIPQGWVAGNSLHVAHFRDGDLGRLTALLGVFSSVPFEFQVRSLLSTGHVSLAVVRRARTPSLVNGSVAEVAEATLSCVRGQPGAEARLEQLVARAYGIGREAWAAMARSFGHLTEAHIEAVAGGI